MTRFACCLLALVTASSVARADVAVEVGGTAGLRVFNSDNALGIVPTNPADGQKSSTLFGLRVGAYLNGHYGLEIEGGFIPTEPNSMVFDLFDWTLRAQLVYQFSPLPGDLVPFVLVGGGLMDLAYSKNQDILQDDKNFQPYVGIGAKYATNGGWGVRADVRVLFPPGKSTADGGSGGVTEDIEALVSLTHTFGGRKPMHKIEPVKPVVDNDPDHDGIVGAADKCPNEPEDMDGFQDADGCPDPDNDNDGIPDAQDKCPNEAEDKDGFQDADGCPDPDNDGDGIPDAQDKCPNEPETKNGYQDADGCPDEIPEKVKAFTGVIQGINFKTGASDLAPASLPVLDKAIAVMAEFKDIKLEIGGHTDDVPLKSKAFTDNAALSQARADSVKAYFVKKGIDASRVTTKGYGDTQPITDPKGLTGGALDAARAKNRRVEFKLVSAGTAPAAPTAPAPAAAAPAPVAPPRPRRRSKLFGSAWHLERADAARRRRTREIPIRRKPRAAHAVSCAAATPTACLPSKPSSIDGTTLAVSHVHTRQGEPDVPPSSLCVHARRRVHHVALRERPAAHVAGADHRARSKRAARRERHDGRRRGRRRGPAVRCRIPVWQRRDRSGGAMRRRQRERHGRRRLLGDVPVPADLTALGKRA